MRAFLICNPAAGSAPDVQGMTDRLRAFGVELTEDAAPAERVIVVGGDGTIAPGAELAARRGVPLAVVPAGTANDFARAHGLPEDIDEAIALAADPGAPTRRLELAEMDGRPFVNVAGAGLAPAAAERAKPFKRALGPTAYAAGAVMAGASEDPIAVTATVDGQPAFAGHAWQVTVASTGAFGGGAEIDDADPADGRLDLVVVPESSRAALPKVALAMRRGTLTRLEEVVHRRGTEVLVHVPGQIPFNVDGEIVEAGPTVRFTVRPGAFALLVPT
jgi:YegS/Rv2252/BmrU family lipid kinase